MVRTLTSILTLGLLVALAPSNANAQVAVTLYGLQNDLFGQSVADIGDVNGDGVTEFAVGAPNGPNGPLGNPTGVVYVYDGASFAVLYTLQGAAIGDQFGWDIAATGSDIDLDGRPDFVVGAPRPGGAGYVRAFSGATGALLWTSTIIGGSPTNAQVGFSVASLGGDLVTFTNPGINEVIVGAPFFNNGAGAVYVLDGETGGQISLGASAGGIGPGVLLGFSVDGVDVDGNGTHEVLAGAPGLNRAYVFNWIAFSLDVANPTVIGSGIQGYGASVKRAGNLNGNPLTEEIVVGGGTRTQILTPQGGAFVPMTTFDAVPADPAALPYPLDYGCALDAGFDRNGDGSPDVLISARGRTNPVPSGVDFVSTIVLSPVGLPTTTYWDANGVAKDYGRSVAFVSNGKIAVGAPRETLPSGFMIGSVTVYQ